MVPQEVKQRPNRSCREEAGKEISARARLAGAKLGPLVPGDKITLKDSSRTRLGVDLRRGRGRRRRNARRDQQGPNASADVIRKFLGRCSRSRSKEPRLRFRLLRPRDRHAGRSPILDRQALEHAAKLRAKFPITLEPLCRILGKRDVRFILKKSGNGEAVRVSAIGHTKK